MTYTHHSNHLVQHIDGGWDGIVMFATPVVRLGKAKDSARA